jgi:uncharacterized protein YegJ (DUF2314 family)
MGLWDRVKGWFRGGEGGEPRPEKKEAPSLVLLLPRPRNPELFNVSYLRTVIGETCGVEFAEGGANFVTGEFPAFIACFGGRYWSILHQGRPYFEDPSEAAAGLVEMRVAHAVREHRAWLSLTLVGGGDGAPPESAYRTLGPLAVALAEQKVHFEFPEGLFPGMGALEAPQSESKALAVYWPAVRAVRPFDEALCERLCGDEPLSAFRELHLKHAPVLAAKDDDPRLVAAVEEARRRWPEFVAALAPPQPEQTFAVKAPIREGDKVEFMWLSEVRLEGDTVHGALGNDPVELKQVRRGDALQVPRGEVVDWLVVGPQGMQGGFTVQALKAIHDAG